MLPVNSDACARPLTLLSQSPIACQVSPLSTEPRSWPLSLAAKKRVPNLVHSRVIPHRFSGAHRSGECAGHQPSHADSHHLDYARIVWELDVGAAAVERAEEAAAHARKDDAVAGGELKVGQQE